MEKSTSQLVEEAVLAVRQGEISLETGASRFGTAWPEIKSEVALILDLEDAGKYFKAELPAPNLNKMWSQILPDLTLVEILPLAGNETNHDEAAKPSISTRTRPTSEEKSIPVPGTVKEPGILPPRKPARMTWRKPLAWAAAIALIVALSLSSLVGVANAAEPGDFFYSTKLLLDNARQIVAFSPQDKREFALSYCSHRSEELEWLVKNNKLQYFADVASDYQQTLQKAFTNDKAALSPEQANQIKAQRTRLTQLAGQLSTVNATGASQATVEVNNLVQQLDVYQALPQSSPAPATTPGTPIKGILTPSATPGTASPGVSVTTAISATTTLNPPVTGPSKPGLSVTPAITQTVTLSPTTDISTTIVVIPATPGTTLEPLPISTPTPTSAASDRGSNIVLSNEPSPAPTQVVSGKSDDSDSGDQTHNNDTGSDKNTGNSYATPNPQSTGTASQQNNGHPKNPPTQSARPTPTATPVPPTATPTAVVVPTPTPALTVTPIPPSATAPGNSGNNGDDGNNNGNKSNQPKTDKPTSSALTDKPTGTPTPEKTKKSI